MRTSRLLLFLASLAVVAILLASGAAFKAVAGEGSFKQMLVFSEVLSYVVDNYVDPVDTSKVMSGAYEGLMGGLDARGAYLPQDEVEAWKKGADAERDGSTGLSVLKSGPIFQVVAVAERSPAADAGIVAGDQVRKIDGHSVRTMSLDQVDRLLNGSPGSAVGIDLVRVRDLKRDAVSLRRAVRSDAPFRLDVQGAVAVLKIRDIERLPSDALVQELSAAKEKGADRLLVDVRDFASGDTRRAVKIASLFATGEMLKLKDHAGRAVETLQADRAKAAWSGRVGVLVNNATAGAGEGIAMILQDRLKAPVYGESTYGLGTEARLLELPEGGGLLVPAYIWETPAGKRWNGDGLAPDEVVRADSRPGDGTDEQLEETIQRFTKKGEPEAAAKAA